MWTFFMPIVFFYFIGTVTSGMGRGGLTRPRVAVRLGADAGFLAEALVSRLRDGLVVVTPPEGPSPDRAFEAMRPRVEIPDGFTEAALAGRSPEVRVLAGGDGPAGDYALFAIRRAAYTVLAEVVAAEALGPKAADPSAGTAADRGAGGRAPVARDGERSGGGVAPAGSRQTAAGSVVTAESLERLRRQPRTIQIDVVSAGRRKEPPTGFAQAVPGNMVMFTMLVLLTGGAAMLVAEREQGMLRRLASAPMSRGAVVLGKWGAKVGLGLVQIAFALLTGRVLFGFSLGPNALTVLLVLAAYAAFVGSLGLLLGSLARTEGQAVAFGVLAANVTGALGGCWWPIEITPPFMQKLALAFPTGWAMDALHRLIAFGLPPSSVLPHLAAMAGGAVVLGAVCARVFRFR
jgi:hypothetical protein